MAHVFGSATRIGHKAVFENVNAVQAASRADPETLEIAADTKAKVAIGDYSRGGEKPDRL